MAPNDPDDLACIECRARIAPRFCEKCEIENDADATFCKKCGKQCSSNTIYPRKPPPDAEPEDRDA